MKGLIISRIAGIILILLSVIALLILVVYSAGLKTATLAFLLLVSMSVLFSVGFWLLIRIDLFATEKEG